MYTTQQIVYMNGQLPSISWVSMAIAKALTCSQLQQARACGEGLRAFAVVTAMRFFFFPKTQRLLCNVRSSWLKAASRCRACCGTNRINMREYCYLRRLQVISLTVFKYSTAYGVRATLVLDLRLSGRGTPLNGHGCLYSSVGRRLMFSKNHTSATGDLAANVAAFSASFQQVHQLVTLFV